MNEELSELEKYTLGLTVDVVNRHRREAVLSDGERVSLTMFFDENFCSCDPEEAVVAIGEDAHDRYWSIDLTQYEKVFGVH